VANRVNAHRVEGTLLIKFILGWKSIEILIFKQSYLIKVFFIMRKYALIIKNRKISKKNTKYNNVGLDPFFIL